MYYYILPTDKDLQHHGVLGQEWGKKNGPPYPLDRAGKIALRKQKKQAKKNFKELRKVIKRSGSYESNEVQGKAKDIIQKSITHEDVEKLDELLTKWKDIINNNDYTDFVGSKQHKAWFKESYEQTFNTLKKESPDYLDDIIKKNGGSKENLDAFHDFRKTMEGFEDTLYDKYATAYRNSKQGKIEAKREKAWNAYTDQCEKITDKIIGKYKDVKIDKNSRYKYSDVLNVEKYWDTTLIGKEYLSQKERKR